ncbi:phenylacetate--CoA ligase family protein [Sandaracinus amylolyticus]|uniref:Coenzyme F390 synthetase n=1 Tax=Sandaracinus amylolyticus TaxID=927083 RepID=A0A0F6SFI8_9BACT|nr:AMP-binding protein [Sandaracinus amylolyticus]AKF07019.1 Coenzyme F390 synthetase [Sandaracinus amylolyticus]
MTELEPPSPELLRLSPLADARAAARVRRIEQHPSAPIWRWRAGDRIDGEDLRAIAAFEATLRSRREDLAHDPSDAPPERVIAWLRSMRDRVPIFRARIREGIDLARSFSEIATSSREDLALRPELLVPDDAPLERMIVYRTAGTTGHALLVPHDARAASCYLPLVRVALERWGVDAPCGADEIGAFNVGAQRSTVTYACTLSAWGGTGFAKLNVSAGEWHRERDPVDFFADLAPRLLTGDPISFAEAMRVGITSRPRALLTTAVAMSDALRDRLRAHFGAPVIDWYSLTETGPLAYACRDGRGHHVLSPDVHVEIVDEQGAPMRDGERGEVTVTGGRNPFVPLLRYRTGDFARIERARCTCGDPTPRLCDLEGRAPVPLRANDGALVNTVDVGRALRPFPLVQHALVQRADRSIDLVVRAAPGGVDARAIHDALVALFGDVGIEVRFDAALGDRSEGKVLPYRSELPFDE